MKKAFLFAVISIALFSCDQLGLNESSSSIGGSSDLPMNEVGNTFNSVTLINGQSYSTNSQIEVIKSADGVTTVHVNAKIPDDLPFSSLVTSQMKDANGNLDVELKYKNTTEGVLDYNNLNQQPFVIGRYDAKVGDKYILEKSDGKTITRTVTAHSTDDDFAWVGGQWMYLKTVTVEQDSRIPGVSKLVYNINHKYGLVGIEVVMEDGSCAEFFFNSASY